MDFNSYVILKRKESSPMPVARCNHCPGWLPRGSDEQHVCEDVTTEKKLSSNPELTQVSVAAIKKHPPCC